MCGERGDKSGKVPIRLKSLKAMENILVEIITLEYLSETEDPKHLQS